MSQIFATLHDFLKLWVSPKAVSSFKPHLIFEAKAAQGHRSGQYIKCSASDMLSLCRPLAYFLQVCCLEKNLMEKECRCFLAWISLLEYCHSIHQLDQPIAKHMEDLVQTALACLVECGWVQYMRPKMHWRLHFPGVVPRFGILPSCWTCERKHKVVRKYGSNCFNVQHYDTSVLRRP